MATTMAADEDDNEVDGDGVTARDTTQWRRRWPTTTMMTTTMTTTTGDNDDDGDGATGDEVDDFGDGMMRRRQ